MGAQLHQPTPEESGVSADLDRLAELLVEHPPDRLDLFWDDVMAKRPPMDPNTISGQLQSAIVATGKTQLAIAEAAGVDAGVISRFMCNDRDLRLETVDKIAAALGLRLCQDRNDAK